MSLLKTNKPSSLVEGIDLDVTPIMNMFVILIPFLVSMAVFTHYSALQFTLPSNAGVEQSGPTKNELRATLTVKNSGLTITLGDSLLAQPTHEMLPESLMSIKKDLKRKNDMVLAIADDIAFEKVVSIMDICKQSGFSSVALSEAYVEQKSKGTL